MAIANTKAHLPLSSNRHFRQQQLLSLISVLCAPRQCRPNPDVCRLIVDSQLAWRS
ncbi:MAG: hypothetical protein JOZ06_03040, partial [Paludibacterium sp.]|nr:hypothetical protein [Paludibacterium sp.]